MKTQIIPQRCSPPPGLHCSLPPAHSPAVCHCAAPNTPPLSPLYPSTPLSPPSLSPSSPSLTPSSPNARSCQAVSGARCGGEIATRMHSQMHEYTYTKHMVLTQARLQGLCYLCCTHIRTHAHTEWWSSASALLRSASLGCLTKAKLWLSRLLRLGCLSDTHTHTLRDTHKACMTIMHANTKTRM